MRRVQKCQISGTLQTNNASITVAECLLIIMAYVNCHKVTDKALSDLLKMFKLLCPNSLNTDCLNSIQKFKDFFSPTLHHHLLYCINIAVIVLGH